MKKRSFTLIELLVVIAIIMILAALLLPTLSKVRYRAKLVVCANAMHQAGLSALLYANENDTRYFGRTAVTGKEWGTPATAKEGSRDDRDLWREWSLDEIYCPFAGQPDFENTKRNVVGSISHYAGSQFKPDIPGIESGTHGMFRIGKPFMAGGKTFDILAADITIVNAISGYALSSHPDAQSGLLRPLAFPNKDIENVYWANWLGSWGGVDLNFCREDGSVFRKLNVSHMDPTLSRVPYKHTNYYVGLTQAWSLLPNVEQGE